MALQLLFKRTAAVAAAAAALLPAAARADKALVVGVNRYPNLRAGADLGGCVSDAKSAAAMLTEYGFQVRLLSDNQATKQGVLNALAALKTQCGPSERFVFYFAGHGTDQTEGDKAALLPNDAQNDSTANDLKRMELYNAIRAIPARSRTALLDSCYSGGMLKSLRAFSRTRRTRYYARDIGGGARGVKRAGRGNPPASDGNAESDISGGAEVCYYTAARDNEQAAEEQFGVDRHGVFTYFMTQKMSPRARDAIRPAWSDLHAQISGDVARRLQDQQHPMLSPEFADTPLFEARGAQAQAAGSNLYAEINADHPDPAKLRLVLLPNKTTIDLNEEIQFEVRVGEAGYLVIFEKGTSGKWNVLHPSPRDEKETVPGTADDAAVRPGVIKIPDARLFKAFKADTPGTEYVKAYLLPTREMAETFLEKFPATGATREQLRDLQRVPVARVRFYTSDLTFEVVKAAAGAPARQGGRKVKRPRKR